MTSYQIRIGRPQFPTPSNRRGNAKRPPSKLKEGRLNAMNPSRPWCESRGNMAWAEARSSPGGYQLRVGARAWPRIRLPTVLAVIFICTRGLAGTTVL